MPLDLGANARSTALSDIAIAALGAKPDPS